MTGPVVIDYKGDRIMDYLVWYLAGDSDKFYGYMKIPLTYAGRNTTACVEWLVMWWFHAQMLHAIFACNTLQNNCTMLH